MTYNEFIDKVIIDELHGIVYKQHLHYHGFILIACSIEFAGALLDKHQDLHARGQSKKRFELALQKFPVQYHDKQISSALYNTMRCGMCHSLRPESGVLLTHREEASKYGTVHLQRDHKQNIYLICEDLCDDLCGAIKVIRNLPHSDIRNLEDHFLFVPQDNNTQSSPASGSASYFYFGTGCSR